MSQILSDNFARANANPLGSPYGAIGTNPQPQIVSDIVEPVAASTLYLTADTTNSYPNDQWVQGTLGHLAPGSGAYMALLLRVNTSTNAYMKAQIQEGITTVFLTWFTGPSTSGGAGTLTLSRAPVQGDVFYFQVKGTTYTLLMNGTVVGSQTDTHLTAGSIGFGCVGFSAITDIGISLIQAGSFTSVAAANDPLGGGMSSMNGGMAA